MICMHSVPVLAKLGSGELRHGLFALKCYAKRGARAEVLPPWRRGAISGMCWEVRCGRKH